MIGAYAFNVFLGMRAHARYDGVVAGVRGLSAPVSILRDNRGVPHIAARNVRDMFFAQGYVEGSDRLFQMDLLRRFIEGRLAEVFGSSALSSDETERAVPIRSIVAAQWANMSPELRGIFSAFSDGVNAAMQAEPLPVEFRILAYRPAAWTPQDSLSVAMAEVLDQIEGWDDTVRRDAAYRKGGLALLNAHFPFTDPCYDAPVTSGLRGMAAGPSCKRNVAALLDHLVGVRPPRGSNDWAVGADRSATHRALLANDPHLSLGIPGIWYLVDERAPGFHAAGVSLPGTPGVILGHNAHLAWGVTDGTTTAVSVFQPPAHLEASDWQTERFSVRFGHPATQRYYRDRQEFGVTVKGRLLLVRWQFYTNPTSAAKAFLDLDTASTVEQATSILAGFPGPALNFVLADTSGRAAYALAARVPNDPVRSRWIHPASDLAKTYPPVPYDRLPHVAPSRNAVVWTANNKMYGSGYPYALSPQFAPPYRAYRIAELLRARRTYDVAYFARMQMDALSLPELELAHDAGIDEWNGEMSGDSVDATRVEQLRVRLTHNDKGRMPSILMTSRNGSGLRRLRSLAALGKSAQADKVPWRSANAVTVLHPLSSLGITFLNGTTLPGYGDAYTLHVQYAGFSQSFRAVWDVGNWDAGGITLPQGESGEPGSGHYTDQAAAWISGKLWPLPFSNAAVQRTAASRETLEP